MRSLLRDVVHFNQERLDSWVADRANEIPTGARVLDVAAGGAPYRSLFSHCDYKTQDFCQLSAEQIILGKYAAIDYVSEITKIPIGDGGFVVILSTEVLEHVPYPVEVLKEMARVLLPGGRLLMSVPLGSGVHQEPYHFYDGYTPFRSGPVCLNNFPRFISGLRVVRERCRVVHGGGRRLRRTGRRGGQLGAHRGFHLTRPASTAAAPRGTFRSA